MPTHIKHPSDFTLRAPAWEDAPGIVVALNACWQDTLGTQPFTVEELRNEWQRPGFDLSNDAQIAVTPVGELAGYADLYTAQPYVRNFLFARVHPAYRGWGIGSALTQWGELRIDAQMFKAPTDARITLGCNNVSTHEAGAQLLLNHGFAYVRSFYSMKIEMDSPPPPPQWPPGITLRSMMPNQEEEMVYRAVDEAFQDHWGHVESPFEEGFARWLHFVQHMPHYDPGVFFLALVGEEIAGFSLCTPQDNEYPDMAWIGQLGVRRPWRRRGLALALLQHTFAEFYRRDIKKVGLGVDASSLTGATRLYEKAGMHVFQQWNTYEKELRAGRDLATRQITEE